MQTLENKQYNVFGLPFVRNCLHVWAYWTHKVQTEDKAPKSDIVKERRNVVTSTSREISKNNIDNVNQGSQSGDSGMEGSL